VVTNDSTRLREQFRHHYAQLSDGELVKLASKAWSLNEAAWEALEAELDRRHLEISVRLREQFRHHYARLSDGELLKLASEARSLNDAAWEALEAELDRRHLEIPEEESTPEMRIPDTRNLVLLRRFRDIPEALLAKGKLDAFGIECFLADENMVRMDWLISNLLGGVKLLVEPSDFTRASRILNEPAPPVPDIENCDP
jgi:hypothetical protein